MGFNVHLIVENVHNPTNIPIFENNTYFVPTVWMQ